MRLVIWICPTDGCGNYYAASSAGDLAAKDQSCIGGKPLGRSRATCPSCAQRGMTIEREPHGVIVPLLVPS